MTSTPHITSLGGNGGIDETIQVTVSPPVSPLQHARVAHRRIQELQQMQDVASPAIAPLSPPTYQRENSGSHHRRKFPSTSEQSIVDSSDVVLPNGPRHATMDLQLIGAAASDSTDGSGSSSATKSFCMSPGQVVRIQLPKGYKKRQHPFGAEGDEGGEGGLVHVAYPPARANPCSNLLSATSARGSGPAAPFVLTPSAKSTTNTPDPPRGSSDDVDSFQSSPSVSSIRPEDLERLQGPPKISLAPLALPSPRAAAAGCLCPPPAFIMQVSRRLSAGRDSNGSPSGDVEDVTFFDENVDDQ